MTTFQVFCENREMVKVLTDKEAGKLFKALFDHAAGEEPGELGKATQVLYMVMAGQADRMAEAYEDLRKKRQEAGRAGGLAKASNASNAKQNLATNTNTNTNAKTKDIPRTRRNTFFDFEQRTGQDLDRIVREAL